jgi:hypothetical protein
VRSGLHTRNLAALNEVKRISPYRTWLFRKHFKAAKIGSLDGSLAPLAALRF